MNSDEEKTIEEKFVDDNPKEAAKMLVNLRKQDILHYQLIKSINYVLIFLILTRSSSSLI